MIEPEKLNSAKEGGRRKVYRFRFPQFLDFDDELILRTLERGEIANAFRQVGHYGLVIPEDDRRAGVRFEDLIFQASIVQLPDTLRLGTAPAGLISTCAKQILEFSGFTDNGKTQLKIQEQAKAYAESMEGKLEALVVHTLNMHPIEVQSMTYPEFAEKVYQAIALERDLKGSNVLAYLDPENPEAYRDDPRRQQEQEPTDSRFRLPEGFQIGGLNYKEHHLTDKKDRVQIEAGPMKVYNNGNNLNREQQIELLRLTYGNPTNQAKIIEDVLDKNLPPALRVIKNSE